MHGAATVIYVTLGEVTRLPALRLIQPTATNPRAALHCFIANSRNSKSRDRTLFLRRLHAFFGSRPVGRCSRPRPRPTSRLATTQADELSRRCNTQRNIACQTNLDHLGILTNRGPTAPILLGRGTRGWTRDLLIRERTHIRPRLQSHRIPRGCRSSARVVPSMATILLGFSRGGANSGIGSFP